MWKKKKKRDLVNEMGRLRDREGFGVKMKKNGEDLREIEGVGYGGFREREGRKRENVFSEEDEVRGKGNSTAIKNLDRGL